MTSWSNLTAAKQAEYAAQFQQLYDLGFDMTLWSYRSSGDYGWCGSKITVYPCNMWATDVASGQYFYCLENFDILHADYYHRIAGPKSGSLPPLRSGYYYPAGSTTYLSKCGNAAIYPTPLTSVRTQTQTYQANGRITKKVITNYSIDANTSKKTVKTYRIGGSTETGKIKTYQMNVWIQASGTTLYRAGGRLIELPIKTYQADGHLQERKTVSYSVDMFAQGTVRSPYQADVMITDVVVSSYRMGGHILKDQFPAIKQIQAFNLKFPNFAECGYPYDSRNEV